MGYLSLMVCLALLVQGGAETLNEPTRLILRTRQTTVVLDKEQKGALVSFVDNATGQEFVADRPEPDLFWLALSEPGDTSGRLTWLRSQDAEAVSYALEERGHAKTAKLTFRNLARRQIQVECLATVREGDDSVLWRISVDGPEPMILEEVAYPVVGLRAPLSHEADDDAFVAGLTKGGVFCAPSRWPASAVIHARQPGNLAAQFGCYYSPAGGFYSAARDNRGHPKALQVRRTESGLQCIWRRYCHHHLSKRFDLGYEIVQRTFTSPNPAEPTDWRHAADIYKAWALKQPWCARSLARRDDLPEWLKTGPAMVRFNRRWLSRPERIEAWLKDYWQARFPQAPLIVAFWGWERVDAWISPEYFPPYPSEQGLRKCVRAVRSAAGHPFFWPSGYHWAVTYNKRGDGTFGWDDREDFEKVGLPHAVRNRDGSPWGWEPPWLRGGTNRALCRGDQWTRQWFNDICVELTRRGADLIQVDQVVGGLAPGRGRCYSTEHGHPPGPGLWDTEAFAEQLDTMLKACRRLNPDIVIGIEEPQELFIQQVGIQDYRDHEDPWGPPKPDLRASVFGYLYHEFVPCFQSNPSPGNKLMMAYCLVNGQIPHFVPHWPVRPSPLLRNGAFEEWNEEVPDGWQHVRGYRGQEFGGLAYRDETAKHSGGSSLRLENRNADDIAQVSQNVRIGDGGLEVGRTYRLGLWFRAPQMSKPNKVMLGAFDARWDPKNTWAIPLIPSEDWQRGEVIFTIPEGAVRLRIMLHVIGAGKVWLDDVVLEESSNAGEYQVAMQEGIPAGHDLALQWVRLFHGEARPYLLHGRMLHPPRLRTGTTQGNSVRELPAILHNAYRAPDGSEAVVAVNITDEAQECVLSWRGRERRLQFEAWETRLIRK